MTEENVAGAFEDAYFEDIYGGAYDARNPKYKHRALLAALRMHQPSGRLLDIGCAYGKFLQVAAEEGGYDLSGCDVSEHAAGIARERLAPHGVHVQQGGVLDDPFPGETFDVVLALEIVEHVADVGLFVTSVAKLVRPGGIVIFSTLNRTPKAWALAVFGAERVMRWLPVGTHSHAKFVKPSELAGHFRHSGLELADLTGLVFSPLSGWSLNSRDLDVNYFATATRSAG